MKLRHLIFISMLAMLMLGCKKQYSYAYLMQHPAELKQQVAYCQAHGNQANDQDTQCETILFAAASFISLVNEQQDDPQQFGQKILSAETACATKQKNASDDDICEQVKTYMAVMSLSSPE
jgi:hypothetical protein